ncbi:MAG: SDR family oxidoreductase [Ruminococcaceae bacterium]|nr:SDR family oxidoreductase [Oscillospiraceae bacterium]
MYTTQINSEGRGLMKQDIFSMDGKVVVFTGGCGKLGKTMVKALLEYGASVAVPARTDRFDESYNTYRENGKLAFIESDLSDTESTRHAFKETERIFGGIDVLVNCAAYGGGTGGKSCEFRLDKVSDEVWNESIDGTLSVIFRCTREVIPFFDKRGGGNIVNFGSMYGMVAPYFDIYGDDIPWNPPSYGAGKAGVIQFTRYCAAALARRNIRVNSLTPGAFPEVNENNAAFISRLSEKMMLKRTGKPEELNGTLLLLCSDASTFMTGTNIVVDGGATQW